MSGAPTLNSKEGDGSFISRRQVVFGSLLTTASFLVATAGARARRGAEPVMPDPLPQENLYHKHLDFLSFEDLYNPESDTFKTFVHNALAVYLSETGRLDPALIEQYTEAFEFCLTTEEYAKRYKEKTHRETGPTGNWGTTLPDNTVLIDLEKTRNVALINGNAGVTLLYILSHEAGHLFVKPKVVQPIFVAQNMNFSELIIYNGGKFIIKGHEDLRMFDEAWVDIMAFLMLYEVTNGSPELTAVVGDLNSESKYRNSMRLFRRLTQNITLEDLSLLHRNSELLGLLKFIGEQFNTDITKTPAYKAHEGVLKALGYPTDDSQVVVGYLLASVIRSADSEEFGKLLEYRN